MLGFPILSINVIFNLTRHASFLEAWRGSVSAPFETKNFGTILEHSRHNLVKGNDLKCCENAII